MNIEERELFNVVGNADATEGRGAAVDLGWFVNGSSARMFAKGRGPMGSPAEVRTEKRRTIRIDGGLFLLGPAVFLSVEDAERRHEDAERKAALSKLTAAERRLLGLE